MSDLKQELYAMPHLLSTLAQSEMTEELCVVAVLSNGFAVEYVPSYLRTSTVLYTAIKSQPKCFYLVAQDCEHALCVLAVTLFGENLKYVPKELRDREIILCAIAQNPHSVAALDPYEFTTEIAEIAVKENPVTLAYLPIDFRERHLCERAVFHCWMMIRYVPPWMLTPKMVEFASDRNENAHKYIQGIA